MFENISVKIRVVATVEAWIGIISSVIMGLVMMLNDSGALGFFIIVMGSLVSWISSFVLYGFGELIEQAELMNSNTYELCRMLKSQSLKEDIKDSKRSNNTSVNMNNRSTGSKWVCPKCMKLNDNTIRMCSCGHLK